MELSDGIAMMVGNNDRMQGIVSQLEETCRAIEVSLLLLMPTCSLDSCSAQSCTDFETQALKHPWSCV